MPPYLPPCCSLTLPSASCEQPLCDGTLAARAPCVPICAAATSSCSAPGGAPSLSCRLCGMVPSQAAQPALQRVPPNRDLPRPRHLRVGECSRPATGGLKMGAVPRGCLQRRGGLEVTVAMVPTTHRAMITAHRQRHVRARTGGPGLRTFCHTSRSAARRRYRANTAPARRCCCPSDAANGACTHGA